MISEQAFRRSGDSRNFAATAIVGASLLQGADPEDRIAEINVAAGR
jgi:hypothetical protein